MKQISKQTYFTREYIILYHKKPKMGGLQSWLHSSENTGFFLWLVAKGLTYRHTNEQRKRTTFVSFLEARKPFMEVPPTLAMTMTESPAHSLTNTWQGAWGLDVRESTTVTMMGWIGYQRVNHNNHFIKNISVLQNLLSKNVLVQVNDKARHTQKKTPHQSITKQTI